MTATDERRDRIAKMADGMKDAPMGGVLTGYKEIILRQKENTRDHKDMQEARDAYEMEIRRRAEAEGLDQLRGDGITVSVTPAFRAAFEPEEWERILLELVGIDRGMANSLAARIEQAAEQDYTMPINEIIEAIRACLTPGNLHIVQRLLTTKKVVALAESGTPLPDGVRLDAYSKVGYTMRKD